MLRDKAIRHKLLVVLGFVIVLQAGVIGWSVISPAAVVEPKQLAPYFKTVAMHDLSGARVLTTCDWKRGNLIYFSMLGGTKSAHHLIVIEKGCPKTKKVDFTELDREDEELNSERDKE